jgi:hypothetical protein
MTLGNMRELGVPRLIVTAEEWEEQFCRTAIEAIPRFLGELPNAAGAIALISARSPVF